MQKEPRTMTELTPTNNAKLAYLKQDALERLEWPALIFALKQYASFIHTAKRLENLSPWINESERDFYFNASDEMIDFLANDNNIDFIPYNLELFEKALQRAAILNAQSLYQILIILKLSEQCHRFFKSDEYKIKRYHELARIAHQLKPNAIFLNQLQRSVTLEGEILSTASIELHTARSRLEQSKRKIIDQLEEIMRKTHIRDALQDNIWMIREGRYVLPVRTDRKGDVEGIFRGLSQSGSTIFIEPSALAREHAAMEKASIDVEIEEQRILRELSEKAHTLCELILENSENLTLFDELRSRAKFAQFITGVRPHFIPVHKAVPLRFAFCKAKHPLFIVENKSCVANDLILKSIKDQESSANIWVLSGPNAGGKTVAMRTVGLCVLMAKAGLYLPCEHAELINYEDIFVELGDRQSREDDLSTFSGHLKQIQKVTEIVNRYSLVLLDEGFVGTDPAIGVAMARSTLEFLAEKEATVIITTHFSSLKMLSNDDPRFTNASMEFEPKALAPTYKLLNGIPGQSYALELAMRMGIPSQIITQARKYYGNDAERMESILKEMQFKRIEIEEEHKRQKELSQKIQTESKFIEQQKNELIQTKETLVESYRTKLQKRLNAFENRLHIRERQFEKHQDQILQELNPQENKQTFNHSVESNSLITPQDISVIKTEVNPINHTAQKRKKITNFEDLSQIKLSSNNSSLQSLSFVNLLDTQAEKTRKPKNMTSRSLLDEAQESLEKLNVSFDHFEEDLEKDVNIVTKKTQLKKEQIAKSIAVTKEIQAQEHSAQFWQSGMSVKTQQFKMTGVVLKNADAKGLIECQFGPLKSKIPYYQLQTIQQASASKSIAPQKQNYNLKAQTSLKNSLDESIPSTLQHSGNTLDLRGKTVEEALDFLELGIDKFWRQGLERAVIIHGHGTGRIRESVKKYVESCSYSLTFRLGNYHEGGNGVTIICLKH